MTNSQNSSEAAEKDPPKKEAWCPDHGRFEALLVNHAMLLIGLGTTEIWSKCPECATIERNKRDAKDRERESVERQRRVELLLRRSGIPARFMGKKFADYRAPDPGQQRVLTICQAYAERWESVAKKGASLVLTGGPGTGKTHLACSIADAIAEANLASTCFVTVYEMLRAIKSTYRKDSEIDESDAIASFSHDPDLLIVDEVGVQIGSDHEKLLLFDVLNSRYSDMRPTVLISNLNAIDLEVYLGHRLMDRFRECGSVIAFDWQSHRGVKS